MIKHQVSVIIDCSACQAVLWNMDTLQTESTPEEHKYVITDVRFRPNSTQFATASVDKSVRIWDAANVSFLFLHINVYTIRFIYVIRIDWVVSILILRKTGVEIFVLARVGCYGS